MESNRQGILCRKLISMSSGRKQRLPGSLSAFGYRKRRGKTTCFQSIESLSLASYSDEIAPAKGVSRQGDHAATQPREPPRLSRYAARPIRFVGAEVS